MSFIFGKKSITAAQHARTNTTRYNETRQSVVEKIANDAGPAIVKSILEFSQSNSDFQRRFTFNDEIDGFDTFSSYVIRAASNTGYNGDNIFLTNPITADEQAIITNNIVGFLRGAQFGFTVTQMKQFIDTHGDVFIYTVSWEASEPPAPNTADETSMV